MFTRVLLSLAATAVIAGSTATVAQAESARCTTAQRIAQMKYQDWRAASARYCPRTGSCSHPVVMRAAEAMLSAMAARDRACGR